MLNNIEYGGGSNIDITTTLDENSTDAQVASAKAVYDVISNVEDNYLPLTGGVVNGSISFQSVDNGYCGITKHHDESNDYGMLIQDASKDGEIAAIKLCAKSGMFTFHNDRNGYEEVIHTGNISNYVSGEQKQIPKTKIEFTNTTNWSIPNTNLESFYLVKSGWCFLHIIARCNVVANDANSTVFTGLPKPPFQVYGNFVGNDYTYNPCQLTIGVDGRMLLRGGTEGKDYSFTYSYPVVDSSEYVLYKNGVNNAEFAYFAGNAFPTTVAEPTITLGDNLVLELNSTTDGGGGVLSKAIDLTPYNTLSFTHTSTSTVASEFNRTACVITTSNTASSGGINQQSKKYQNLLLNQTNTNGDFTIDISDLSGEHYIWFEVSAQSGTTTKLVLSDIYLTE